jgi:TetR/AcrR family transcriptional repressor of nem operon
MGKVIRLLDWVTRQFWELGLPGPDDLALALVGAYQGISLVASALRGAKIMTSEGTRLTHWLDTRQDSKNPGPSAL